VANKPSGFFRPRSFSITAFSRPYMNFLKFPLLVVLLSGMALASPLDDEMSPPLRSLLVAHPVLRKPLDQVISEMPRGSTLRVRYGEPWSPSKPSCSHWYDGRGVVVSICTQMQPYDEYLGLYFEIANSLQRQRFEELFRRAKAGTISRDEFPIEVMKGEFVAMKRTTALVRRLPALKEQRTSRLQPLVGHCPADFDRFLAYGKRVAPLRNPVREYQEAYDELRRPWWRLW
jgi:hypothetical protein